MSALNEIVLLNADAARINTGEEMKAYFRKKLWEWIVVHYNDKVTTIRVLFLRKTIRVRDLEPVFVLLLGPQPFSFED